MRDRQTLYAASWATVCLGSLLLELSGCALLNGFLDPTKVGQFPSEYQERGIRRILTPRDTPLGPPNAAEPTPEDLVPIYADYLLAPGDVIVVIIQDLLIAGVPEQVQIAISPTGNIRIPVLGSVKVVGLSEQEVEEELKARLRESGILPDPDVRLYAQTKRRRMFTVRGSVGRAGLYPIDDPDTRLLDVIGMVQDIGANVPKLYVIRRHETVSGLEEVEPFTDDFDSEGLVIPPPDDEDFQVTFSTASGLGNREPPAEDELEPEIKRADLEAVIVPAPPARTTQERVEPDAVVPFEPLIFDPESGELVDRVPISEPAETAVPPGLVPEEQDEQPFDWEDVPELDLEQRVIEIDVRALLAGDSRFNIVIRDRDVINVPIDTGVYYMMGEVARPGVYGFGGRDITIKQALASSGGLGPFAWPRRCEIIRHEPGTDKQVTIPVNLDAIFAGLSDDVFLRNDDIINVGTHFVAPFLFVIRNSFRFTYGFGFVYDRNFADQDSIGGKTNPETIERARKQSLGLPF